jgi:DNA-binding transcriptional LysR family regulator
VRRSKIDEKDMSNIPFILKTGGKTLRLIKGKSIKPNVTMECDSLETVLAAVRNGIGIGILYSGIAEPGLRSKDLKRIRVSKLDEIKISWYLAFKRSASLSEAAGDFLSFLLKCKRPISSGEI